MKLIWLSDLHLEFLGEAALRTFVREVAIENPDAVLITGDISNSRLLKYHLEVLAESWPCPIYFVLGNHDFYLSSFAEVDALVMQIRALHPNLIELGHGEVIKLGSSSVLIGHRGWADGRAGKGSRSTIRLNDQQYITDLREPYAPRLFAELNRLGDVSADYISQVAPKALQKADRFIIATHVPPFPEAALFQNKPSDPDFAPHFVNIAMGRAIRGVAQEFPEKSFLVLCGHTHHRATYDPATNLKVEVATAAYYHPQIAAVLNL